MTSETKFMLEKNSQDINYDCKDRISNVTSDSQTFRLSDSSDESNQIGNQSLFQNYQNYKHFFQPKIKQSQFSTSIHKKSINWLITFCWTRNYSEQILWYSIGYFYSYTCFHIVKKDRLTLILISAVNLALKLFESNQEMGLEMMKESLNGGFQKEDFRKVEEEFVKIFDFDLFYPTLLGQILRLNKSEEEISKILYLSEILFFNNYEPAFNDILLEDILLLVQEPQTCNNLKTEIMKLSKNSKYLEILKQKFSSKFNTDEFMNKILNQY